MKRYLTLVLLLALCLTACTPKAPAPTETAPPPEAGSVRPETPAPVWGEQVFQRDYAGEESNADAPEGVVVSLRFVMPYIENAGENPVWRSLNEDFSILGEGWLEKGREYWSTPGLEPGGDYSVESVYTIQRCDRFLSVRYQRTEALAGEPAGTVSGSLFDLSTVSRGSSRRPPPFPASRPALIRMAGCSPSASTTPAWRAAPPAPR